MIQLVISILEYPHSSKFNEFNNIYGEIISMRFYKNE